MSQKIDFQKRLTSWRDGIGTSTAQQNNENVTLVNGKAEEVRIKFGKFFKTPKISKKFLKKEHFLIFFDLNIKENDFW